MLELQSGFLEEKMTKRERLEVIFDILKTIQDNQNSIQPTPLLRRANLSSSSFADYFEELLAKDFVKQLVNSDGKNYVTLTDKGFRYLEKYNLIRGFIDEFEL